MALKVCLDCGALSDQSRCPQHRRTREQERNRNPDYDTTEHRRIRRQLLASLVDGQACPRCGNGMDHSQALDLDHLPDGTRGLSHADCNRRAGGQAPRTGRPHQPADPTGPFVA
jgi:hypothetical protein